MEHDVFISYSSKNIAVAEYILAELTKASINCWMAPKSLSGGEHYEESIPKAIRGCRVFVLIYSEPAGKSCWVSDEVTLAHSSYKYIIPFRIDNSLIAAGMELALIRYHWIEAFPEFKAKIDDLVEGIRNIIRSSDENRAKAEVSQSALELNFAQRFEVADAKDYFQEKRYEEAINLLLPLAIAGNKESQELLCLIYFHMSHRSVSADNLRNLPLRFKDMIEPVAELGVDWANFIMHCYAYKQNDNEASLNYLKYAIQTESLGLAFLRLGIVYGYGLGVEVKWTHAMKCYMKAEELGCAEVYSYLGQTYRWGYDKSKPDFNKAVEYYKKGVEAKDWRAICGLLDLYLYSYTLDDAQKFLDSLGDDAEGIELLYGEFYRVKYQKNNCKCQDDFKHSVEFLEIALNKGFLEAYGKLASIYYKLDDIVKAEEYAQKGYECGDSLSYHILYLIELKKKNIPRAWKITEERNRNFCEGGGYLGQIYIEHNYLPYNDTPSNDYLPTLLKLLETNAKIGGIYSCGSLITLYSEERFGIKDPEKEEKYRRMAAHIAETLQQQNRVNYILDYAKYLLQKDTSYYNPISAIKYLMNAVEMKSIEASEILLNQFTGKLSSPFYMKQYDKSRSHILKSGAYDCRHSLFVKLADTPVTEDNASSVKDYLIAISRKSKSRSGKDQQKAAALLLEGKAKGYWTLDDVTEPCSVRR